MNVNDLIRMLAELPAYVRECEVEITDGVDSTLLDGAYQAVRFIGEGANKDVRTSIVLSGNLSAYIPCSNEARKVLPIPRT